MPKVSIPKEGLEEFRLMYYSSSQEDILKKYHWNTWHAVSEYARKRGFRRNKDIFSPRRGTIAPLLEESFDAYYWMGFILADGCFQKSGQLVICSAEKDKTHLDKLALFLKTETKKYKSSINADFIKNGWYRNPICYRVTVLETKLYQSVMDKFNKA